MARFDLQYSDIVTYFKVALQRKAIYIVKHKNCALFIGTITLQNYAVLR